MTREGFESWATVAKAGEACVYHRGTRLSQSPSENIYAPVVHAVRQMYNEGWVDLVQRRSDHGFDYIAIMRETCSPPVPAKSIDGQFVHRFRVPCVFAEVA